VTGEASGALWFCRDDSTSFESYCVMLGNKSLGSVMVNGGDARGGAPLELEPSSSGGVVQLRAANTASSGGDAGSASVLLLSRDRQDAGADAF